MNGCLTVGGIIFLLPFVAVIYLIIKLVVKAKNQGWKGTVINKLHKTKDDPDRPHHEEHFYTLTVSMDNGEEHHIAVSYDFWNSIKIGDKIEKPKGELQPKKVKATTKK